MQLSLLSTHVSSDWWQYAHRDRQPEFSTRRGLNRGLHVRLHRRQHTPEDGALSVKPSPFASYPLVCSKVHRQPTEFSLFLYTHPRSTIRKGKTVENSNKKKSTFYFISRIIHLLRLSKISNLFQRNTQNSITVFVLVECKIIRRLSYIFFQEKITTETVKMEVMRARR